MCSKTKQRDYLGLILIDCMKNKIFGSKHIKIFNLVSIEKQVEANKKETAHTIQCYDRKIILLPTFI